MREDGKLTLPLAGSEDLKHFIFPHCTDLRERHCPFALHKDSY